MEKLFFISSVIILCFTRPLLHLEKPLGIPNKEFEEYMQHILSIYIPKCY